MGAPLSHINIGRSAIPDAEAAPLQVAMPQAPERPQRPRTCLIVDDSRVVRKVSRPIIESLGYAVIEAENGEEALLRCQADMPELIMLDWDMPVMTGIQFVAQLRALDAPRQAKVVFCTSRSETQDIFKGIEAGADEYVTKPFNAESLKAKLERIGAA
ncbi:MAG TPA: response regulator [Sphingorhabdus sp.]|jgi:two-component system chemotaxis response regulator CheY|nr:response regulator [Sphingorhabdus sp.]